LEVTVSIVRTVNAISDRLLGLVVPRVTAHADCGETWEYCFCIDPWAYFKLCCRNTGACNSTCNRIVDAVC
jgi:hypothetical protein